MKVGLAACLLFVGCSAKGSHESTSAAASAAPAPSADPARRAAAKKLANTLDDPSVDPSQRARIAAMGLSEERFGLRKGILKALGACAAESIDPSQCARILGQGLETSEKEAVSKRCGIDLEALRKEVEGLPLSDKTPALVKRCKVTLPPGKAEASLNPWAVLTSAVLSDELHADPLSNEDEQHVVAALIELQHEEAPTRGADSAH